MSYASHFYGQLDANDANRTSVNMSRVLSAKDAEELNETDEDEHFKWGEGDESSRFMSDRSIIDAALATWKEHFPEGRLLIMGDRGTLDPQLILDGPAELMEVANEIYEEFETYHGWDCDEEDVPIVQELTNRWRKLIGHGI